MRSEDFRERDTTPPTEEGRPVKRQTFPREATTKRFFRTGSAGEHDGESGDDSDQHWTTPYTRLQAEEEPDQNQSEELHQQDTTSYFCKQCQKSVAVTVKDEHEDWHFAKELEAQDRSGSCGSNPSNNGNAQDAYRHKARNTTSRSKRGRLLSSRVDRSTTREKGQSRLAFG